MKFSFKEFLKKNYLALQHAESATITIVLHAIMFVAFAFIIVSQSDTAKETIKTFFKKQEERQIEPPKPVVQPKDIPVTMAPPPPRTENMPDINDRMMVKKDITSKLLPKTQVIMKKTKIEFDTAKEVGRGVRQKMNSDYRKKYGVAGHGSTVEAVIDKFVVVEYEGGDWYCELVKNDKKVDPAHGTIPNLIGEIRKRTNIRVNQDTVTVVRADSKEIHESPFVYFTGHDNFVLTEAEVENLRAYILQGGAIIANSALPGRRSRFDMAFRREMNRVMPNFPLHAIDMKHPIYESFTIFKEVPEGMNYWKEPLEVIEVDDRIAVIYNLNDYGELMWPVVVDNWTRVKRGYSSEVKGWCYEGHLARWNKNVCVNADSLPHIDNAHKMFINMLAYLLTR